MRADDVPSYYEYNLARIEGGDPGLDAEALAAAAEPALADLGHRRIEVEDTAAGARWRRASRARLGRRAARLPAPRAPAAAPGGTHGAELRVGSFEATRALRAAWQGESIWGERPGFALIEEQVAARRGTRAVDRTPDGEPAGFAAFSAHGDTVEIEWCSACPSAATAASAARCVATRAAGGARRRARATR